ncbi:sensor histidine kinase [Aliiroseovarius sp. YM-037]|uniref:sensor histidine kinase n=1 Tax=Aliiroseovarius sp. YM-037 TaxID=3341728 RepID=UPI003A7F8D18
MAIAALILGSWVTFRIERGVVENFATSAALYMESFISPVSHEFTNADGLTDPSRTALRDIFLDSALGARVVSYKIWGVGGEIIEASNSALVGQVFDLSDDQLAAWNGAIAASFEDLNDIEDAGESALGIPLLEIYSPIIDPWSGEVIAVAEFYEDASDLATDIRSARLNTWLIVAAVFVGSSALLIGVVEAGSRQIESQRTELSNRLVEAERLSQQNEDLSRRVRLAAQRSTAQADRVMQRIGQELHDGVAQHLSLAGLRLIEAETKDSKDAQTVRASLDAAMQELRAISRGLSLPDIESLTLGETLHRAAEDHIRAFGGEVEQKIDQLLNVPAPHATKLCCYRFIQEALYNAHKHANADSVTLVAERQGTDVVLSLTDDGAGFDPDDHALVRQDGGQGLMGLRDRAETLRGRIKVVAAPGNGTAVSLELPISEAIQ